jgi:hypothetical protein
VSKKAKAKGPKKERAREFRLEQKKAGGSIGSKEGRKRDRGIKKKQQGARESKRIEREQEVPRGVAAGAGRSYKTYLEVANGSE